MRAPFVSGLLLLIAAVPLAATEDELALASDLDDLPFVDMRLGYGMAPAPDKYAYHFDPYAGPPAIDVQDRFNNSTFSTFSLGLVGGSKAPIGWVAGIEGIHTHGRTSIKERRINGAVVAVNDQPSLLWRSTGGNAMAGIECSFTRLVHLELLGVVGGGRIRFDALNGGQDTVGNAGAWYWDVGARAGAYVRLRRAVLGAIVDYTSYRSPSAFCGWADGTTVYDKSSWSGVGGRIELGYQLQ